MSSLIKKIMEDEIMLSRKENYLIALRGGKPEYVPNYTTDNQVFVPSAM